MLNLIRSEYCEHFPATARGMIKYSIWIPANLQPCYEIVFPAKDCWIYYPFGEASLFVVFVYLYICGGTFEHLRRKLSENQYFSLTPVKLIVLIEFQL